MFGRAKYYIKVNKPVDWKLGESSDMKLKISTELVFAFNIHWTESMKAFDTHIDRLSISTGDSVDLQI